METKHELTFTLPEFPGRVAVLRQEVDAVMGARGWYLDVFFCDILVATKSYGVAPGVRDGAKSDADYLLRGEAPPSYQAIGWTFEDMRLDR